MSDESDDNLVFLPLSLTLKPNADVKGVLGYDNAPIEPTVADVQVRNFFDQTVRNLLSSDLRLEPGETAALFTGDTVDAASGQGSLARLFSATEMDEGSVARTIISQFGDETIKTINNTAAGQAMDAALKNFRGGVIQQLKDYVGQNYGPESKIMAGLAGYLDSYRVPAALDAIAAGAAGDADVLQSSPEALDLLHRLADADTMSSYAWRQLSYSFTSAVTGKIIVIVGDVVRDGNLLETTEIPRLLARADVGAINYIDHGELVRLAGVGSPEGPNFGRVVQLFKDMNNLTADMASAHLGNAGGAAKFPIFDALSKVNGGMISDFLRAGGDAAHAVDYMKGTYAAPEGMSGNSSWMPPELLDAMRTGTADPAAINTANRMLLEDQIGRAALSKPMTFLGDWMNGMVDALKGLHQGVGPIFIADGLAQVADEWVHNGPRAGATKAVEVAALLGVGTAGATALLAGLAAFSPAAAGFAGPAALTIGAGLAMADMVQHMLSLGEAVAPETMAGLHSLMGDFIDLVGPGLAIAAPAALALLAAAASGSLMLVGATGIAIASLAIDGMADALSQHMAGAGSGAWFEPGGPFYFPPISPLVLDLDGNGLDLIALADSQAHFDLDRNGIAEQTAWIGPGDGLLALDRNGNGTIDDLAELFGGGDVDGFTVLAAADANGDQVIDAQDPVFGQLAVWRDLDGDGATDPGELQSLVQAGVAAIALDAAFVDRWIGGSWVSHESRYADAAGQDRPVYDVWFENSQVNAITTAAAAGGAAGEALLLPNVGASGDLPELHGAMTADPALLAALKALVLGAGGMSAPALKSGLEAVLLDWAGAAAAPGSRGDHIDARHLAFLEAVHGQAFHTATGASDPGPQAGAALESYYQAIVTYMSGQLLSQFAASFLALTQDVVALFDYPLTALAGVVEGASAADFAGHLDLAVADVAGRLAAGRDSAAAMTSALTLAELLPLVGAPAGFDTAAVATALAAKLEADGVDAGWRDAVVQGLAAGFALGSDGADTIAAAGAGAVVIGFAGDDSLAGTAGRDMLIGGSGDDAANGGAGSDTYVYNRGDGHDSITETTANGSADRLVLHGVTQDALSVGRSGGDATLVIAETAPGAGDGGQIILVHGLDDYYSQGVEQVAFDDGTLWLAADLRALYLAQVATDGADVIAGFNAADTLAGGPGDDALDGGGGNDAYVYARGDGNDTITETTGNGSADRLVLHGIAPDQVAFQRSGADVVMTVAPSAPDAGDGGTLRLAYGFDDYYSQGIEQIAFDDGTVWTRPVLRTKLMSQAGTAGDDTITGTSAADVIAGGRGNDSLNGGDGSDVYLYVRGDGQDVITEAMYKGTGDELVLQAVTPDQVSFLRAGNDITLVIAEAAPGSGDGGTVTLVGGFDDYFEQGVERVSFGDGTTWSRDDLRSRYFAQVSTAGADAITGFKAADTITGGRGNDTINGNDGDDVFVYARGDGDDIITETSYNGGADRVFLHGVPQDDLSFGRSGNDVTLVIAETTPGAGDGGSIRLVGGFDDSLEQGVEQVAFDDGTVWARPDLRAHYFARMATAGDDAITGFNTADTIAGGRGNDSLAGGGGNDSYIYNRGDGDDSLTEAANGGTDQLVLHGIAPADVAVQRSGSDVKLVLAESAPGAGDGGTIRLVYGLDEVTGRGVEQVALDDGTSWSRAELRGLYFAQAATPGADTIIGFSSADIIAGGGGGDTLTGGSGADLFRYVSVADSAPGAVDIIADFLRNTDHIDLAALDANAAAPGDQTFAWIGTAAFSHAAGELRYAATATNIRTVFGDVDGDGVADLQIQLNGSMSLTASDFML